MRLRTKLVLVISSIVMICALIFAFVGYQTQKTALVEGIDAKLFAAAHFARGVLGADFHDKITGPETLSKDEYLAIVDRWNRLCKTLNLEYIWSLMVFDGAIVFTSGSSTSKDVRNGDHALFFETHSNPEIYLKTFETMEAQYQINDDKWGRIRAVLVPFRDAHDRPYLFGASMKTTEVDALTRKTLWKSLGISGAILLVGIFYSVLLANSLSRPIETLTAVARNIAGGDLNQTIEAGGSSELRSLSGSIGRMSLAIRERLEQLRSGYDSLQAEIAEREKAEEALRESEENLRQITENMQEVFWLGSLDFEEVYYVSPAYETVWGVPARAFTTIPARGWTTFWKKTGKK